MKYPTDPASLYTIVVLTIASMFTIVALICFVILLIKSFKSYPQQMDEKIDGVPDSSNS